MGEGEKGREAVKRMTKGGIFYFLCMPLKSNIKPPPYMHIYIMLHIPHS